MMQKKHKIGPYFPSQDKSVVYCMVGDEPLMFLPKKLLNHKQLNHLNMMRDSILPYAMATIPFSNENDKIVLDIAFMNRQDFFEDHLDCYQLSGIHFSKNIHFASSELMYQKAINIADPNQMICSVCFSHELHEVINIHDQLEISKAANSKLHLIANAKMMNYTIPPSFIVSKEEILQKRNDLFNSYPREILCKTDGLGGGFNVREIKNFNDLVNEIDPFKHTDQFIIQEKIDKSIYTEFAIDFIMKNSGAECYSARKKLTYNNQWFGNIFDATIKLNQIQKNNLNNCLSYLSKIGYVSQEGYVCGLDVLQNDTQQYILEINARWSGGFPIAKFLDKINYQADAKVTAYMDYISHDELKKYIELVKQNLFTIQDREKLTSKYKIFPTGFCPVADDDKLCIWISVFGHFDEFLNAVTNQFSDTSFTMAKMANRSRG